MLSCKVVKWVGSTTPTNPYQARSPFIKGFSLIIILKPIFNARTFYLTLIHKPINEKPGSTFHDSNEHNKTDIGQRSTSIETYDIEILTIL